MSAYLARTATLNAGMGAGMELLIKIPTTGCSLIFVSAETPYNVLRANEPVGLMGGKHVGCFENDRTDFITRDGYAYDIDISGVC